MLRIISGLILLIISQMSFASISTSGSIVSATPSTVTNYVYKVHNGHTGLYFYGTSNQDACTKAGGTYSSSGCADPQGGWMQLYNPYTCSSVKSNTSLYSSYCPNGDTTTTYTCSSGTLSDSSGNASSSGQYCNTTVVTDSCASYAGQKIDLAMPSSSTSADGCYGTCAVSIVGSWGSDSAYPYNVHTFTYTGKTGACTTDTLMDSATAQAKNDAYLLKQAEDACGSQGYIIDKLVSGPQSVICNSAFANLPSGALPTYNPTTPTTVTNSTSGATSSATSTNPDGTTTTTTTNTTTTSDTSSTGGTGGSTTTTTTTTVKNPDGTTKSTSDTSTGTGNFPGLGANYKYADSKRNDWGSRNFSTVISDNMTKLKATSLYGSATGFFTVSFSGSAAPSNFNATYKGSTLSASFDWAANLAPFQGYIRAVVMFVCCYVAFKRCIE